MKRAACALLLAASSIACPSRALAQDTDVDPVTEARQQYQQGRDAFAAKRYVEAAMHFEAAAAQRPHAVALYTAALAWDSANRPERAADAYGRALEVPGLSGDQATKARDRVAQLEKALGTLAIMVPDAWRLQLDDYTEVVGHARLHAPPGVHSLKVRAPGRGIVKREVSLEAGQITRMELTDETLEPPSSPKQEPVKPEPKHEAPKPQPEAARADGEAGVGLRRSLGFVAIGVGGAGLLAGVVLGTQALSAKDAYDAAPSRSGLDHAKGLETWTNVAFIAGGVLAAGGVALVVWPERAQAKVSGGSSRLSVAIAPSRVSLGGSF